MKDLKAHVATSLVLSELIPIATNLVLNNISFVLNKPGPDYQSGSRLCLADGCMFSRAHSGQQGRMTQSELFCMWCDEADHRVNCRHTALGGCPGQGKGKG